MKKILVIDGNSIINRAFYGVRPLTTKTGKHTNAIYGMVNMIMRQLESVKPDYALVAFDIKHPTFRHKMFPEYKAGRHPTPPELLSQFDDAKECLRLMGLKVMELPGWEADDIQGTVASMAYLDDNTESYVFSGDRDLLQLIGNKITVLLATNTDTLVMRREEFVSKYGIEPKFFVDMKALMGDSSDNIPGVAGVGEKTAQGLIKSFETLEGIYGNIEDKSITKGVREKLLRDKDNAFLSRTLARIDTSAPVGITLADIAYTGLDKPGLYKKFSELEFNAFITKYHLDEASPEEGAESSAKEDAREYVSASAREVRSLAGSPLAIDFEGETAYVATPDVCLSYSGSLYDVKDIFEDKRIICYDGKSLWHRLDKCGIDANLTTYIDIMMYEYVINPGNGSAGLASLASSFIGKTVGKDAPKAHLMLELLPVLDAKIKADGLDKILYDLELPLIPVLAECEKTGFKVDKEGLIEFGDALAALANELAQSIYTAVGESFNLNSPKQLAEVLYDKLGLSNGQRGKAARSTDAETLQSMRLQSPIIDDILEYRHVTKLHGTYCAALAEVADEHSRIHTDFKQALTATGRLSSADPNLQNIPIKTKMGRQMRRFFIAEEGYSLVDADYSQIELRLLAHISDDYNMCEAFRSGEDIHRKTASAVFNIPEEMVTEDMRKRAKAVNFGIVYGISGFSLAKDIGSTVPEATRYIKSYLLNYPFIDAYLEDVVRDATSNGYTKTPMGRIRYIPELRAAQAPMRAFGKRVAMNAPIQGAAADIIKLAMIKVSAAIKREGLDARLVMQVHDELIVEAHDSCKERVAEIVKLEMEGAVTLSVPLTVDVTIGKNWLDQE